jgi:Tfp pilus assembly protein PilP
MSYRLKAAIALALLSRPALAQDEIDAPAGELPKGDDMQDQAGEVEGPTLAQAPADDSKDGVDQDGAGDKKAPDEADGEITQPAWDSYEDKVGGAAEEITKGVRVEDIIEPPSDYRYAAFGKGDPFVPPVITEEATVINPLEIPIVSPLQRYRLQELSLVGIWQHSSGERKAMIMTPANELGGSQGIIIKNGDPIGQKGGRILGIGDDYLTIREFTLAPDGTRQYEDQQMFMGRRPAEDIDGKIRFEPGSKEPKVIINGEVGAGGQAGALRPVAADSAALDAAAKTLQNLRSQAAADASANAGKVAAGPNQVGDQQAGAGAPGAAPQPLSPAAPAAAAPPAAPAGAAAPAPAAPATQPAAIPQEPPPGPKVF